MSSTIHFILNEVQEQELEELMKKEGITSRAGFFRFLMKFYKYHQSPQMTPAAQIPTQAATLSSALPSATNVTGTNATRADEAPTHLASDANLSPEKQKLLNNPLIFDEEIRQLIRDLDE